MGRALSSKMRVAWLQCGSLGMGTAVGSGAMLGHRTALPPTLPALESDLQPRVGQPRGRGNDHRRHYVLSLQNPAHGAGAGGPGWALQFPAFSPCPPCSEDQKLSMGAAESTCRIEEQHPRGWPLATLLRRAPRPWDAAQDDPGA